MIVIKRYFIDSDKIHAQIQENKLKEPKKQGKFRKTSRSDGTSRSSKSNKRKVIPIQALRNESFFFIIQINSYGLRMYHYFELYF
jgi:hypothetical protein